MSLYVNNEFIGIFLFNVICISLAFYVPNWTEGNNTFLSAKQNALDEGEIQIGERVLVVGQRTGIVRFYGTTKFAPGNFTVYHIFAFQLPLKYVMWFP